jgi:hypothetical protein
MEFYSHLKKNEILPFVGKWMELENFLNEVTQSRKPKVTSFLSHVEYMLKTNTRNIMEKVHT